jgi:hypothetical protein
VRNDKGGVNCERYICNKIDTLSLSKVYTLPNNLNFDLIFLLLQAPIQDIVLHLIITLQTPLDCDSFSEFSHFDDHDNFKDYVKASCSVGRPAIGIYIFLMVRQGIGVGPLR